MRTYAAVVIVVASLFVGCERREEPKQEQVENVAPARTPEPPTPIVEGVFVDEVDVEFEAARQNFVKRDFDRTAESLNNAAGRVTAMGESAGGKAREELKAIGDDLARIAADVKNGNIKEIKKFDSELAGVQHSLAKHHLRAARAAMGRDMRAAGRELNAAAHHVEGGYRRWGKDLTAETQQAIQHARAIGGKLIEGVEQSPEDVEKAAKALELEVDKLGHEVRSHLKK